MAYGLSYMGVFDTVHWKKIVSLALAEPLSSPCVAFLLHGAVTTCPDKNTFREEIGRIRIKLRDLAVTGGKTERYEAYVALGQIGDREDWSFITDSFEEGDGDDGLISAEGWRDIQSARAYAILKMNGVQKTQGFTWLDWSVVVVFLLLMLMIGYSSSKQNKTASDYVLGGRFHEFHDDRYILVCDFVEHTELPGLSGGNDQIWSGRFYGTCRFSCS